MLNFNSGFQETFQKVERKIAVILLLSDQDASSSIHRNRKNAKRETLTEKIGILTSQLFNKILLSACKGIPNGTACFTFTGAIFIPLGKHPLKILTITVLDQNQR